MMLSIINQLRLRSMMVDVDELPNIEMNEVESVKSVVSKLFGGKEEFVLGAETKFDSQIIVSKSQENQIISWLEEENRRSEPKLLYRASRDGWERTSFHSRCDECKHTLVIVKTSEGYVFGGYNDQSWGGSGDKSSSSSFLFSLKCYSGLSPTKMKVKSGQKKKAVYCSSDFGPCFGSSDIEIGGYSNMREGSTVPSDYEIPSGAPDTFLTGKTGRDQKFDIAELEVFEV